MKGDVESKTIELNTPKSAESLSRKDRWSLLISSIALLLSVTTLVLNRYEAHQNGVEKGAVASYNAYKLGKMFGSVFIAYTQVNRGDPAKVEEFKSKAIGSVKTNIQPIADRLDLRTDIATIIENYHADDVFNASPVSTLEDHIRAVHGEEVTGKFRLGFWLFWIYANSQIVSKDHPNERPELATRYTKVATQLNKDLKAMALQQTLLSEHLPSLDATTAETLAILKSVEEKLTSDRR